MNKKLVRVIGIGALGVIAAVALACSGGGSSHTPTTGPDDAFLGEDGGGSVSDPSAGRDLNVTIGDKAVGAPVTAESRATSGSSGKGTASAQNGAAPAGSAPSTSPALPSTVDRKIVETASLQMQVEDVGGSFEEVGRIATAAGGFVASSKFSYRGEQQIATVTIRVPSAAYQSVLGDLRGLAKKVDAEDSNAADVTEEYTDLTSRLRNLEATYTQLLTLLGKAQSITDILTVQDRLNAVTGEIEQVKGRMQLLDNLTEMSTVTVHLAPVAAGVKPDDGGVNLGQTISEAWDDSLAFLGGIAEGVLTVLVFAWWVPVVGVPAGVVAWSFAGTRNRERGTRGAAVD